MARSFRIVLALTLLLALTIGVASTATAGGPKVLDSTMAGMPVPNTVLNGVTGAGAPWQIASGKVQLFEDGRIHVNVVGLVIPGRDPGNPVAEGKAVVTCGDAIVDDTALVPFSPEGNATIDDVVTLPDLCQAPAVFFTNAGNRWFAVTGF